MPDRSDNAPVKTSEETPGRMPATQEVYREPIELFRLEQALPFATTPERQHNILSLIITRELAQALNIPRPPDGTALTRDFDKDQATLRNIRELFRRRRIPVPGFPSVEPLTGKAEPEYLVVIDGDTPHSVILRNDLASFIEVMMRNRLQAAYQEAVKPLWDWHLEVRFYLSKYKVWDMDSEFVGTTTIHTEADIERQLASARRFVDGMAARQGAGQAQEEIDTDDMDESYPAETDEADATDTARNQI
jgi:hypothetical protein